MKMVILDGYTLNPGDNPWTPVEALGEVIGRYEVAAADSVAELAAGAQIAITNKAGFTAETLARLPDLRYITVTATGYNIVDIAAAGRRDIPVSNVPEYGTNTVAQYTFALILELCHRVGLHADSVAAGDWARQPHFCYWKTPQVELAGKTLGVVGFGRIGRRVADLAHAFGMGVLASDPDHTRPPDWQPFEWAGVDEVFAAADVVTLHCPLTPENGGLVNRDRLRLMKPTAFLVNAARGGLVNEADLAAALDAGILAGAAVDVVSTEPIRPDNPLPRARNCLVTPHMAWASLEARRRIMRTTAENIAGFLAGRPVNVVNAAFLPPRP
jgi:glycerate dehydrogenase